MGSRGFSSVSLALVAFLSAMALQGCASSRSDADREAECLKNGANPSDRIEVTLCVQVLADKDRQKDIMMLQLMRAAAQSQPTDYSQPPYGQPVYRPTDCIGPVINGACNGSIMPNAGYLPTCYGQMLNGQCTGPMF